MKNVKWLGWLTAFLIFNFTFLIAPARADHIVCCNNDEGRVVSGPFNHDSNACEDQCVASGTSCVVQSLCTPSQAPQPRQQPRAQSAEVELPNPLGETDLRVIIAKVIQAITGVAGSIALLVFVWGGFQWLTSGGNPEKIKKGRDILVWSALGLLVMFGSYLIVRYVLQAITGAAGL